jgi:ABC-type antimicrobial peptide transport system permease subunit
MGQVSGDAPWLTVVGVVSDARYRELSAQRPSLYVPAEQLIVAAQSLAVRTSAPLADAAATVRSAVRAIDPSVHVVSVQPLEELRQAPLARPRFAASLSGAFGAAALVLAVLGVFTVTATSVQQRRAELRIRLALGASPAAIERLIVGEGLRLALVGIAVGITAAMGAARWLGDLLFGIGPSDPPSFAGAAVLLLLCAVMASVPPAWRAARLDPVVVLRQD